MENLYSTSKFLSNTDKIDDAEIVVFGVPFDSTVDYLTGTRFGPNVIREASNFIEPFDIDLQKNLLEEKKIVDIGDISPVRGNPERTVDRVAGVIKEILSKKKFHVMLGGEHAISLGAVKALPRDCVIICLDAHYDLKEVWEGSEITHNTWLRRACEIIGPENVCLVGVRTGDEFEYDYAKKNKILVNPNMDELIKFVKNKKVYLTIDMYAFDPSIAPGIGTPEPGGLLYRETIVLIKEILDNSKLVGLDVVDTRPLNDNKNTEILTSKLIQKVLLTYK